MIARLFFSLFTSVFFLTSAYAQGGCPDKAAFNYNPDASFNDGSCLYEKTQLRPEKIALLEEGLVECSGLAKVGEAYWALNDGGNPNSLFKVDIKTGKILHETKIANFQNEDWEDLAVDERFMYIGNFGNNNGNRKNLTIGRVNLSSLSQDTAHAAIISISYEDQKQFDLGKYNHNFDMEAMIVMGNQLILFSKNWADYKTRVYACPKIPGKYNLRPIDSLVVDGLVTAADISDDGEQLILLGYTRDGKVWLYTVHDFEGLAFSKGNKRRIELGSALKLGQAEAICFLNEDELLIGSEKFKIVKQQLLSLSLVPLQETISNKFPFPSAFSISKEKDEMNWQILFPRKLPVNRVVVLDKAGNTKFEKQYEGERENVLVPEAFMKVGGLLQLTIGQNQYVKEIFVP